MPSPASSNLGLATHLPEETSELPTMEIEPKAKFQLLPPGSRATAAISLAKATLGAGALSVPYTMYIGGFAAGVLLLCGMAVLNIFSLEMIVRASNKTGKDSYADIVDLLFGRRVGYVFQAGMVAFCFGSCAAYMVTIFDLLKPVFQQLIGSQTDSWYATILLDRAYFTLILTVLVLYPLSLVKNISSLRYLTFVGIFGIIFLGVTAMYLLGVEGVADNFHAVEYVGPVDGLSLITALNTYTYAYCNQANIPEIYGELADRTPKKMRQVTIASAFLCLAVYLSIALGFFLVFGTDIQSSVILSLSSYIQNGDLMVIIGFVLTGVAFVGTFPLMVYPVRVAIVNTLKPKKNRGLIGALVVTVTVIMSYVIAIALPDVSIILGLVGAMSGSMLCFIAPGAFNLKVSTKPMFCKENWTYTAFVIMGVISLVLGTSVAVYDAALYYTD